MANNCDDDDDVIFCEISDDSSAFLTETNRLMLTAPSTKRSYKESQANVIEILDSDSEEEQVAMKVLCASPVAMKATLDPERDAEIQQIIQTITKQYGEVNKIDPNATNTPPISFQNLRQVLDSAVLGGDEFLAVRSMVVKSGVVFLLFDCLSKYTHHYQTDEVLHETNDQPTTSRALPKRGVAKRGRWAAKPKATPVKSNGTGYGYGFDHRFEKNNKLDDIVKSKLQTEDEHVTALLQVLASFINPQDDIPSAEAASIELPRSFVELVEQSCLAPVLRSYLRNDSILDMTRHIPLYRAVMLLIRAIATSNQFVHHLMMKQDNSDVSIADLMERIKTSADTYASRVS